MTFRSLTPLRDIGLAILLLFAVGCSASGTEETLYADGDINCPDHFAADLSTPVGTVDYLGVEGGIDVTVSLTDAEPTTVYDVVVIPEDGACDDWAGTEGFSGLTTDQDGSGTLAFTFAADSGEHSIVLNIVSTGDEDIGRYHEIAPAGFTQVDVP